MKRFLTILLSFCMLLSIGISTACHKSDAQLKIYMPDGAPALAMAKLMHDENKLNATSVDYTVVSASTISNYVTTKTADAIIIPLNAATKLAGDTYTMAGVVTHGNLYVVSSQEVNSVQDLKGKVVGAIGMGQVPDLTMKAILTANGIAFETYSDQTIETEKVYFSYFSEASNLLPQLKTGALSYGVLPEPAVSKFLTIAPNYSIKLNVQSLYDSTTNSFPQAVLLVKNSLIASDKGVVDNLINAIIESQNWIKSNATLAVNAVNSHLEDGATPSLSAQTMTETAITNSNIYFEKAQNAKESVLNYITRIKGVNPNAINEVSDAFFMN